MGLPIEESLKGFRRCLAYLEAPQLNPCKQIKNDRFWINFVAHLVFSLFPHVGPKALWGPVLLSFPAALCPFSICQVNAVALFHEVMTKYPRLPDLQAAACHGLAQLFWRQPVKLHRISPVGP